MAKLFLILLLSLPHFAWGALSPSEFLTLDDQEKLEMIEEADFLDMATSERFLRENPQLLSRIEQYSDKLGRIWWDTILEGPYALNGDIEFDILETYGLGQQIYAFLVNVSAPALMIDWPNCDFDYDLDLWGGDCMPGTISESFYIDFAGNIIASDNYADFD